MKGDWEKGEEGIKGKEEGEGWLAEGREGRREERKRTTNGRGR